MNLTNILLLLTFLLLGEIAHRILLVPLSGPLLGMAFLLLVLILRGGPSDGLQATVRPLLAILALLFVPAGVGVVAHIDLLALYWLPILAATVGGAVVSLLVTAGTMLLVERLMASGLASNRDPAGAREVPVVQPAIDRAVD